MYVVRGLVAQVRAHLPVHPPLRIDTRDVLLFKVAGKAALSAALQRWGPLRPVLAASGYPGTNGPGNGTRTRG